MSDDPNPVRVAQRLARRELPKRSYKTATAAPHGDGFAVLLDGRVAQTPAKRPLAVDRRSVAEALAAEWEAQQGEIDPGTMPLTRIVNAAVDRVAGEAGAVRAEIVKYAGSDLVCYRADGPAGLVAAQGKAWAPILSFAREALGARFVLAEGIVHVAQNAEALSAVDRAVTPLDPLALAALHTVTTLTGSALIALVLACGAITAEAAWAAAHVDEDWQMGQWGEDPSALQRRTARWNEMEAAALILGLG
jgi:chaperone required for assembly of F1-ATPase